MNEVIAGVEFKNGQGVIVLSKGYNRLEVIRMVPENEMYNNNLEKNFKKLVDLDDIASAMAQTIQAYINLGRLNGENSEYTWKSITGVYLPFTEKEREYQDVMKFIEGDDW